MKKKTAGTNQGAQKVGAAAASGSGKKKVPKGDKKGAKGGQDDGVQVMTLEMIEEKFDKQTKAYNQRIMNFMRVEQRPLTLQLIMKYAFPAP